MRTGRTVHRVGALDADHGLWNKYTMHARLQVLLAAICFGTTGTAQAIGPGGSPVAVGAARIVLGGAMLVAVARVLGVRLPRADANVLAIAVGVAVYQLSFFAAVKLTGVAVGTVVAIGTGPAAAGALGRLVNGERLTGRWALATACAAAGVVLLAGDGAGTVDPGGIALALVAGVGYATCTVLSKRLLVRGVAPEGVMAAGFGGAAVLLVPVLLAAGPGFLSGAGGFALALYLGAIPTALAYVLVSRGLRSLTSGETATLVLAEPLTAAALGVVALGEHPSTAAAAGAVLVLCGLAVLAAPGSRRALEAPATVPAG
jgi:DME family drug/metabolite transporter